MLCDLKHFDFFSLSMIVTTSGLSNIVAIFEYVHFRLKQFSRKIFFFIQQFSQFWYSNETAMKLAQEVLTVTGEHGRYYQNLFVQ